MLPLHLRVHLTLEGHELSNEGEVGAGDWPSRQNILVRISPGLVLAVHKVGNGYENAAALARLAVDVCPAACGSGVVCANTHACTHDRMGFGVR